MNLPGQGSLQRKNCHRKTLFYDKYGNWDVHTIHFFKNVELHSELTGILLVQCCTCLSKSEVSLIEFRASDLEMSVYRIAAYGYDYTVGEM